MVLEHARPALATFIATAAVAIPLAVTAPAEYESFGKVLVEVNRRPLFINDGTGQHVTANDVLWTEVQLAYSAEVRSQVAAVVADAHPFAPGGLHRMAVRLGLIAPLDREQAAVAEVRERLRVEHLAPSYVVRFGYRDEDPELAHRAVDAAIASYLELRRTIYAQEESRPQQELLDQARGEIEQMQRDLVRETSVAERHVLEVRRSALEERYLLYDDTLRTGRVDSQVPAELGNALLIDPPRVPTRPARSALDRLFVGLLLAGGTTLLIVLLRARRDRRVLTPGDLEGVRFLGSIRALGLRERRRLP